MSDSKQKNSGLAIVLSTVALIIIVLAFTGGLIISSFQQNYTNSIVTNYYVNGNDTIRKIEYSIRYGKPLNNFYGIEEMLYEKLQQTQNVDNIYIASTDGNIIYDQNGKVFDKSIPTSLMGIFENQNGEDLTYSFGEFNGFYYIFLPISANDGSWIGSMVYEINEKVINAPISLYMWNMIYLLVILALLVAIILAIVQFKFPFVDSEGKVLRTRMIVTLLIVLSSVQAVFGYYNYKQFSEAYIELANRNASTASALVKRDVHHVIEKGVPYNQLFEIENYLDEIVATIDEIEQIRIEYDTGEEMYSSTNQISQEAVSDDFLFSSDIQADQLGNEAQIEIVLSEQYYSSRMREIILDTITVIVTSFLFMVEVTLFLSLLLKQRFIQKATKHLEQSINESEVAMIRPLAFIFAMAVFLTGSFIPIVMKEIYQPLFGLSKEVVLGLPITIEMLFAAIATLLAGFLIDRKGWKPVFIFGALLFMIGSVLSGISSRPIEFIGARAISGIGYGFGLMSLRGFVNASKSEEVRSNGFAAFFAGLYAGINIGVIVGSMLAERIGYSNVFFVAFSIAFLAFVFALFALKNRMIEKDEQSIETAEVAATTERLGLKSILGFLLNRKVLALFLLIVVPTTVCSMFLDYYFPVFADSIGVSTSNIGRAFLLNGICIVYLAPLLSKLASKYLGVEKSIVVSGIIVVAGLLVFASQGTLATAFLAVILLGIAESFGLVAQNNYFVKLEATNQIGSGKALGFYDNIRKLGQMAGPMAFGGLAFLGLYGVGVIAIIALIGIVLFFIFGMRSSNKEKGAYNG